jgi:hypothetical protein
MQAFWRARFSVYVRGEIAATWQSPSPRSTLIDDNQLFYTEVVPKLQFLEPAHILNQRENRYTDDRGYRGHVMSKGSGCGIMIG